MEDNWTILLKQEKIEAANVSCFKLAPGANLWPHIVPGVKFVARHCDANPARKSLAKKETFWVVTVMNVQGYFSLVRYLGMGRDATQDFWIHMGKHEIYPVGNEPRTAIFIPPTCLLGRAQDWRTYFCAHLPGSLTLPSNLLSQLQEAGSKRTSKDKIGDHLEVPKDSKEMKAPLPEKPKVKHGFKTSMKLEMANPMNPASIHPATVTQVAGRLLRISFDGGQPVYDQWLDVESPDIYPIGWCDLVGHPLDKPK